MRLLLLVGTVVLAGLAGCVSERGFEPIASAGWQPGYSFLFTAEGVAAEEVDVDRGGERLETQEREPFGPVDYLSLRVLDAAAQVEGEPYYLVAATADASDAYREPQRLAGSSGELDALLAVRPADLAPARMLGYDAACGGDCGMLVSHLDAGHPWIRFPLVQGDTWSTAAMVAPGGTEVRADAEVRGMVTVDGPDGPVDAVRIHHAFALAEPEVPLGDAMPGYTIHSYDVDFEGTSDVYYAPSLHAVVRHEFQLSTRIDADVSTPEGRITGRSDTSLEYTLLLTGYDLTIRPATPLDKAASVLGTPLAVPKGTGAPPEPGSLAVTGSAQRARVGEPAVALSAEGRYVDLESLRWEVRDAAGKLRRVGSGAAVTFPTTEPGAFVAVAAGQDRAGRPVEARFGFAIDLHGERTLDCTLVAPRGPCETAAVPVRPGLQSATILATRGSALPPASDARLELRQDGRAVAEAAFAGDSASIVLEGPVTDGQWEVAYVAAFDSAEVELRIDLVYGLPPA